MAERQPNRKIIVLDDEDSIRCVIIDMLIEKGWDAFPAITSKDVYKLAQEHNPFLICCDLHLQENIDVAEIAYNLIRKYPILSCIAITGEIQQYEIGYLRQMKFSDIILKPFKSEYLFLLVDEIYNRSKRWHKLIRGEKQW